MCVYLLAISETLESASVRASDTRAAYVAPRPTARCRQQGQSCPKKRDAPDTERPQPADRPRSSAIRNHQLLPRLDHVRVLADRGLVGLVDLVVEPAVVVDVLRDLRQAVARLHDVVAVD